MLREPGDVLQRVVDEALRLLRADGALIDQYDPDSGTLQWAYDAGVPEAQRDLVKLTSLRLGEGVSGTAVAEGRVIRIGDYLTGEFRHDELADSLAVGAGIRDLIAAPIVGDAGPLGAIEVFSRRPHAFDDYDAAILGGLAEQAAIAITNARLIDELEHSQAALARRAETERSLRDITARIAALRDPDEVLTRVVEDARRLLGTDGAHLTRMDPSGAHLVPVVVEGSGDEDTRDWLMTMEFPLGGGINGLAVQEGGPIWTFDYLADPRIPHEPDDIAVAGRLGLRGMAAAPLRAPGGEVLGTLAVSTDMPRLFEPAELDLLQGLADQAAIALTNSNLLARVTREEARFRGLVQTTPDVIWRADAEGYFTFVADSGEALFGWPLDEIIGRHFSFLVDPGSMAEAVDHYAAVGRDPDLVERNALVLKRQDGTRFAAEVTTTGVFEDGRWVGAQGTVRDVSERQRLQRELERSEERYRFLVENSPDVVFATDADGNFTFLSAAIERMTGFTAEELTGSHFSSVVDESTQPIAAERWAELAADPTREAQAALLLKGRDGRRTPVDVRSIGIGAGGAFAGIQGATRDISEQVRLQSELRRQAGELAASEERARLARELHDSVTQALFSMTLVSRSVEMLLDVDPAAARDRLGQLRDLQREALAEMRALIFELRPANLEETGLVPALEAHGAALQDRVGLPIAVDSDLAERLPLAIEEMLYRIAQEALHNVIKHAAASMARVELRRSVDGVHLIVSDDGKGFDPSAVSDEHLGLAGMRARAERTGARFRCDSDSGRGTTIEVVVPAAGLIEAGPESHRNTRTQSPRIEPHARPPLC